MNHDRLEQLPIVINEPGLYRTRKGLEVRIYAVSSGAETFKAKGAWKRTTRGRNNHSIWHVSGRSLAIGMSGRDIIERVA